MRLRPLITGTFLAVCFWGVSILWNGAGGGPRQNNAQAEAEDSTELRDSRVDILVTFEGAIAQQGQLVIQLFADAQSFASRQMPLDECYLKLDLSDEILWQFRGLPQGDYAVVAYHDANENWQLDRGGEGPNIGKVLDEKITYSQLGRVKGPAPTFEQCKFAVTRDQVIRLSWE